MFLKNWKILATLGKVSKIKTISRGNWGAKYKGIQIEYFQIIFGVLRVIMTPESTQKSTIRNNQFTHGFTKSIIK